MGNCWNTGCDCNGLPKGLNLVVNWLKPLRNGVKNVPARNDKETGQNFVEVVIAIIVRRHHALGRGNVD